MGFWQSITQLFATERTPRCEDLSAVCDLLGYRFKDPSLLSLSLCHRSFVRSQPNGGESYERLEFLGDSVLGLAISEQLYRDHPDETEGNLTKIKAMLVNETTLAQVGREIGLNAFIHLSPEEDKSGGRDRNSIIADAFEAVIGAIYLDGGIGPARELVYKFIYSRRESITSDLSQKNYKGDLLELVQARGEGVPRYDVVSEVGPDHEKTFHVIVTVAGEKIGEGTGLSKKEAEQKAAAMALERVSKVES
ncbi:MAG: ribonuclease III [candidate division Zixibacteria bacterium]|nr:ribonuclease III [candidate division Zixibacteria bacterium]